MPFRSSGGSLVSTRSARRVGRGGQASGLTLGWNCAATTFAPLIVFALVMGLCSGGWTSLYSAIIKSLVGMLSRSQVYLAHSILLEFTHDPRSSAFQRTTPVSPRTSSRPSPSRAGSARSSARRSRPRSSPTRSAAPRRKRATASRTASTAASSCSLAWRWGWGLGWRRSSGSCHPRSVSHDTFFSPGRRQTLSSIRPLALTPNAAFAPH